MSDDGVQTIEMPEEMRLELLRRDEAVVVGEGGVELRSLGDIQRLASNIVHSGMAPKGDNASAVAVKVMVAVALRLNPIASLSGITFINQRVGLMGDMLLAAIRAGEGFAEGTDINVRYEGTPYTPEWTCFVSSTRKGMKESREHDFSLAEAMRAGLYKIDDQGREKGSGPWYAYTKRMLYYRALGFHGRDVYSDILLGAWLGEELTDFDTEAKRGRAQERDVTPEGAAHPLLAASSTGGPTLDEALPKSSPEPEKVPAPGKARSTRKKAKAAPGSGAAADDSGETAGAPPSGHPEADIAEGEIVEPSDADVEAPAPDQECQHLEGFSAMEGRAGKFCIDCDEPEPDEAQQGDLLS